MFYFPLRARRASKTKMKRSSGRLQLEALEHRLVPTIPQNGMLLITNYHTFDNNPTPPPPGIIGIDSSTGLQSLVAVNGSLAAGSTTFTAPANLCQDSNPNSGMVYVVDDGRAGGPSKPLVPTVPARVLKVQFFASSAPLVTVVSSGGSLVDPTGVVVLGGSLYVTDTGNTTAQLGQGYVLKIDPNTGAQSVLQGTHYQFQCPVGVALVYSTPPTPDTNSLWVADQGSNQAHGANGVGVLWKVDLTNNGQNAPRKFSEGGSLSVTSLNYALGNVQDVAVNPSTGTVYFPQYGLYNNGGSVVSVNPPANPPPDLTSDQVEIAQDDGQTSHPPTPSPTCRLGWYVGPDGWDASYPDPTFHGVAVITAAADQPDPPGYPNQQRGHICAVDPTITGMNDNNVKIISENGVAPNTNITYIATPTGIITYTTPGSAPAPLPSPGHGPAILGSFDVSTLDTMDLFSVASAPGMASLAINHLRTGAIDQPSGVSNLADLFAPEAQADGFWRNHDGTSMPRSILTDGLEAKDNPGPMEAAYFTMEPTNSQWDWLVTTVPALGSV